MKTYNILSIDEFKTNIGNNSRLLGIDPGNKNIGFAISDENQKVATPLRIIKKTKFEILLKEIKHIIDENKVESLSKDLTSIIKFIENLNKLNTDKTVPLTSIVNASLKSRKDEVKDGKIRDQILKNSPEKNEEFFVVPKVID